MVTVFLLKTFMFIILLVMGCFLLTIIFVNGSEPRTFLAKCVVFAGCAESILRLLLYSVKGNKDKGILSTTTHVINEQTLLNAQETTV